jgi:hypothetical protein
MSDLTPGIDPSTTPLGAGGTGAQQVNLDHYVEKKRFDGLMLKVQELTEAQKQRDAEVAAREAEIAKLQADLSVKDTEKNITVAERDKKLEEILQSKSQADQELAELRALKLKLEVVEELGRPELVKILKNIPPLSDKDALKTVLEDFARFGDESAAAREKQLLAGITPAVSSVQQSAATPQSDEGWLRHVDNLPLGSPERAKAMDDYWTWGNQNHK